MERTIRQVEVYGERPVRAYVDGDWLIIAGVPLGSDDVEGWTEEDGHNCDQMGCGQDHVLYRVRLADDDDDPQWDGRCANCGHHRMQHDAYGDCPLCIEDCGGFVLLTTPEATE